MGDLSFRFGEFAVHTNTRRLVRKGVEIHVSPKAFELLTLLLLEYPRALSKRELFDRIWPSVFVSDATLASVIREVREALSDPARRPQYIRTLHRFGYAFCEPVAREGTGSRACVSLLLWPGGSVPLLDGENIIGRTTTPAMAVSGTVSRRHAQITVEGAGATVQDLGSKNGTFVRGRRVTAPISLADGDQIAFGSFSTTYRMSIDQQSTRTTRIRSAAQVERTSRIPSDSNTGRGEVRRKGHSRNKVDRS